MIFLVILSILYVTTVIYILSTGATIQMFQELLTKNVQCFCGEKVTHLKKVHLGLAPWTY
jgi:L-2-hydroxyglutarate oxidase LhgO